MIRIVLAGLGKIAHDQHIPSLRASDQYEMVAGVTRSGVWDGGPPTFRSFDELLASGIAFDAVGLCQPPQARFEAAHAMLAAGKHVLLEKPPGATLSEVAMLKAQARANGVTLFATWHSRFAAGVESAKAWLTGKTIRSVRIEWLEDVRHWHPGQTWIWQPGGMGVFDPGINALSIATHILPPFYLREGSMTFPENCHAPIASDLHFGGLDGMPVHATFDFRQTGPQTWTITVETDGGRLELRDGGARLIVDGEERDCGENREYPAIYDHFAKLVQAGESDVDVAPLRHVADAFTRGRREVTEAFYD